MYKRMFGIIASLALFATVLLLGGTAMAATSATYHLDAGETAILVFQGLLRISTGNPAVLDCQPATGNELVLSGKAEGVSSLVVWDARGRHESLVMVHPSRKVRASDLSNALMETAVTATVTDSSIVLEGEVATPYARKRAEAIAKTFSSNVVNLLDVTGDTRIQIEALILEISKGSEDRLGLKSMSGRHGEISSAVLDLGAGTLGFSWNRGANDPSALAGLLNAVKEDSSSRVLSRPVLIGTSGQKASINVGGEIPVPVGVSNGEIKIEWKAYGVMLTVTPEITKQGDVDLNFRAEVSELDWDNKITTSGVDIPALRMRSVENRVVLADGEPLVVGGLLDSKQTKSLSKIPLLGDIPVLGELFRSRNFSKSNTELVVVLIPKVVKRP